MCPLSTYSAGEELPVPRENKALQRQGPWMQPLFYRGTGGYTSISLCSPGYGASLEPEGSEDRRLILKDDWMSWSPPGTC